MSNESDLRTREILNRVKEALDFAKQGLSDLKGEIPSKRKAGMANAIIHARSVTNILQQLRSVRRDFEHWYTPYVEEMQKDPLMRYFYKWRSEILKEGSSPALGGTIVKSLQYPEVLQYFEPRPNYGAERFIGDASGGSGWILRYPDGSEGKYYVAFPSDIAETHITLFKIHQRNIWVRNLKTSQQRI